ncbi:hypothetical protein V8C26DRAFT_429918 [Trichoderma gracile]
MASPPQSAQRPPESPPTPIGDNDNELLGPILRITTATPPQSAQRPPDSSPRSIGDNDNQFAGPALQVPSSSSASLPVTPITPIGDESELLDPALQASRLISSVTPIKGAAHQTVISPSGKRSAEHGELLARKCQRTRVGSEDTADDYDPGSDDESNDSDFNDAPGVHDVPEVLLDLMDLDVPPRIVKA